LMDAAAQPAQLSHLFLGGCSAASTGWASLYVDPVVIRGRTIWSRNSALVSSLGGEKGMRYSWRTRVNGRSTARGVSLTGSTSPRSAARARICWIEVLRVPIISARSSAGVIPISSKWLEIRAASRALIVLFVVVAL